jgi:hypothetical protein
MIAQDHQITDLLVVSKSSRSIGNKQFFDAKIFHHSHREGDLLHGISFVIMESSLHTYDGFFSQRTKDQFPGMTFNCRNREIWNIMIRNRMIDMNFFNQGP